MTSAEDHSEGRSEVRCGDCRRLLGKVSADGRSLIHRRGGRLVAVLRQGAVLCECGRVTAVEVVDGESVAIKIAVTTKFRV